MVQIHSEAGQRLHDFLVNQFGPIEDGHGRKVYGHKRTADDWRAAVLADLRGEPVLIKQTAEMAPERTTPEPQKSADEQVVEHQFSTTPPSAAHAGRAGRTACLVVLLAAIITACVFNDTVAAAVSAGPIPLLWQGLSGKSV